jgi:hypothetical protein
MGKVLAIVLWALISFCGQPLRGQSPSVGIEPSNQWKQQTGTGEGSPQVDQRGTKDAPFLVDTKGHKNTKEEAEEDKKTADHKDHIDNWTLFLSYANTVITFFLLIVGICGVVLARGTLKKIDGQLMEIRAAGKQTDQMIEHAGKQAESSRRSADAIILNERAWITVLPYIWSPEFYPLWEEGDPVPANPMGMHPVVHQFPAKIKNVGKTPAIIDGVAMRYVRIASLSSLSTEPDYGEISPWNGYFLIPDDDETAIAGNLSHNSGMMSMAEVAEVRRQDAFLYAYGTVKYRDVYESQHETRFGYLYHSPQGGAINFEKATFRRGGPEAYNRTT